MSLILDMVLVLVTTLAKVEKMERRHLNNRTNQYIYINSRKIC